MKYYLLVLTMMLCTLSFSQGFTIDNYDIRVEVQTDGALQITEEINVNFSEKKRGIYRSIPHRYSIKGKSEQVGIKDIAVKNHTYKIENKNGQHHIRIGDKNEYLTGKQSYNISYTIQNGIGSYDDYQELYLDLIGTSWQADIAQMTYTVALPKSITLAQDDLLATTGRDGEVIDGLSIAQTTSRSISGQTNRVLPSGEGATIAIRLPASYLSVADLEHNEYFQAQQEQKIRDEGQRPWWAVVPLAIVALFFSWWRRLRGRGGKSNDQIPTYPYPPEGLTSAHVGAYIDQQANTRDVISLIPYWAAEGYLLIKHEDETMMLTKDGELPSDFPSYERLLFDKMFADQEIITMKELSNKLYTTVAEVAMKLTKEVNAQEYYDERYIYWFRSWRLILFPVVMIIGGLVSLILLQQTIMGIAFFVLGFISLFLGAAKKPLSPHGQDVKDRLDGLKKFLEDVPPSEIDSLVHHDPRYFDKMLPFAVAFGIEKSFIPKFETAMTAMPIWYMSTGSSRGFDGFVETFDTEVIDSAFTSSPASSGGSGGGGFSSGGGVGGGGGGSW